MYTNPKGEALTLELTNPYKSGLYVRNVEGLGPPRATINGNELATTDGMYYTSARAEKRNIIFNLGMLSRDRDSQYGPLSIEESRHLTYVYFPIKKEITITVVTDVRTLFTKGYVETNEPDIFSKEEGCTISVICPDPWWHEEENGRTIFSGIQPGFEFPFSNESLTDPLLEFGQIWLDVSAILEYKGTVDTGILITIHAFGEAEGIRLYNVETKERIIIDTNKIEAITGTKYHKFDDIIISTVKGDRYCRLLRNGEYTNIIAAMSRDSDWFQISNGDNVFGFDASSGAENISVTFSYKNTYAGV